jgi:hypothetical protein
MYSNHDTRRASLAKSIPMARQASTLAKALNDLPDHPGAELYTCSQMQRAVEYAIVLQYQNRQPITLIYHDYMIRRGNVGHATLEMQPILDFWNVKWNELD